MAKDSLDPLEENDFRAFCELFRHEDHYRLQSERLHTGLQEFSKTFASESEQKTKRFRTIQGLCSQLQPDVGRVLSGMFRTMCGLLHDFTQEAVKYVMSAVNYMADYIEFKTENYHRLLVVMSQEVQEHLDVAKECRTSHSFKLRALEAKVAALESQIDDVKDRMMTLRLKEMLLESTSRPSDLGDNPHHGAAVHHGSRTNSGHHTPSSVSSAASSYQASVMRMSQARKRGDTPSMIKEAQQQAYIVRGENDLWSDTPD
jgi:hypothetical protein